jgi:hypothetical protein
MFGYVPVKSPEAGGKVTPEPFRDKEAVRYPASMNFRILPDSKDKATVSE